MHTRPKSHCMSNFINDSRVETSPNFKQINFLRKLGSRFLPGNLSPTLKYVNNKQRGDSAPA